MKFISAAVFELLANKPEQEKVGICTQASVKNKFFVLFRILQVDYLIAYVGMRIFSGSAKCRGFCLARTDLVNRPDP